MTSLSEALEAPHEIRIGGESYKMSPLTLRDFAELERVQRSAIIETALEAARDQPPKIRRQLISDATSQASQVNAGGQDFNAFFSSLGGATRMIYLGIKRQHYDITLERIQDVITSDELARALEVIR
jgi:formiminotetrahydrofolate cyclodeaminase